MGVLDWFKGSDHSSGEMPEEPRADVDWKQLEDAVATAIASQVRAFAEYHRDEAFYGFALDCNAYYANVLFCLNTPESLDASIRSYAKNDHPDELHVKRRTWSGV